MQRDIGGDPQRIWSAEVHHEGVRIKHLLWPPWISAFRIFVNARAAEVQGVPPWSWVEIALADLAALALVAAPCWRPRLARLRRLPWARGQVVRRPHLRTSRRKADRFPKLAPTATAGVDKLGKAMGRVVAGGHRRERAGETQVDLDSLTGSAARGDRAATQQLLTVLAPRVVAVARSLLGSRHPDVEDAAQESLIEIARSLPGYRGEGANTAFANRITVRTTIRIARQGRARTQRAQALWRSEAPPPATTPGEHAVGAQRREILRRTLLTLPEEQAETLALRVCLGASLQEVASQTGVPINTVRSRVRLAKEALRRRVARAAKGDL